MSSPVRSARRPKVRSVHVNALVGALFLTIDGKEFSYWLDVLPHDLGPAVRAYRLSKFVATRKEGEPDHYDVTVTTGQHAGTCECKGHLRWSGRGTVCKHVASLLSLIDAGKLS